MIEAFKVSKSFMSSLMRLAVCSCRRDRCRFRKKLMDDLILIYFEVHAMKGGKWCNIAL